MAKRTATVVLVPGGFCGPWIWSDVVTLLEQEGLQTRAVPLTSMGDDGEALGDLYSDARAVRDVLDRLEPPVLLCGHSYGGAVITQAAAGPHPVVRHLVYLTAAAPGPGDTGLSLAVSALSDRARTGQAGPQAEAVVPRDDGTGILDRDQARTALFGDCDPQRAEAAVDRLGRMNLAVSTQAVTVAAWSELPFTYVRGTQDLLLELLAPGSSTGSTRWWSCPQPTAPNGAGLTSSPICSSSGLVR